MYFVFVVGTGTGMSPHVVMRCVWWCITSRPLLLAWGGSTCSSGTMTIVKLRTTSSANTLQVLRPQYFNILLLWKDLNTVDPDSFSPQSCHWTLPPLPTPLKQVKRTRFLLLKEMLPHMIHQTLWKVIVVSIQSEHYGCFSLQMSSLHLCCRGIQVTTTRTEVQVNRPNIPPTLMMSDPNANMKVTKSVSLRCPRLFFSSEFGLHHHSHHSPDTAVTDSDWSLLLQTACQTVRIQTKSK